MLLVELVAVGADWICTLSLASTNLCRSHQDIGRVIEDDLALAATSFRSRSLQQDYLGHRLRDSSEARRRMSEFPQEGLFMRRTVALPPASRKQAEGALPVCWLAKSEGARV